MKIVSIIPIIFMMCTFLTAQNEGDPQITYICNVGPDILCLTVEQGKIIHGKQSLYKKQPGDKIEPSDHHRMVNRNGKVIGSLVGKNQDIFYSFCQVTGKELNTFDDKTEDPYNRNYNKTDVYEMDFSSFKQTGTFRIYIKDIGVSYPFKIKEDVWENAFILSARSFYHQRSGIELGPPYTTYKRPRCFHPDDGVIIYHSSCPLMDSGSGGIL